MSATNSNSALGVYGFALRGIEPPPELMVHVGAEAPTLGVHRVAQGSSLTDLGADVRVPLVGGGEVGMNLESGDVYYAMTRVVSDAEMLHPWLAPAAYWWADRLGRMVAHGGIVAANGRALALLGDREAGKSSLTAWVATSEHSLDVMTDDVIVIDGDRVFAGPRCVDLRPQALAFLGARVAVNPSRDGTRYRLQLPSCAPEATLAGVVILTWAETFALRPVAATARVPMLLQHLPVTATNQSTMGRLLALAALPMWVLERPRDSTLLDRAVETLAAILCDGVPE